MKWDLRLLYKDIEAWKSELGELQGLVNQVVELKGKLNQKEALEKYYLIDEELNHKLGRLYVYASMYYHQDQKDQQRATYYGQIYGMYTQLISAVSFVESELLQTPFQTYVKYAEESEIIKKNLFSLTKMFHSQAHILDEKSEAIMANYNKTIGNYNQLYDKLATADNSSEKVVISTGEEVVVNESTLSSYLEKFEKQEDRRLVFETLYKFYANHKNTFAGIYEGIIDAKMALVKNRKYDDFLQATLDHNKIPNDVFLSLINTVKENTDVVKRYIDIRKKFFKIEDYHTYDRFLSFTKVDVKYSYEKCKEMFFESCKKISPEFLEYAKKVLADGRVDVLPSDGKRTGAYSNSTYDEGPFILLNHNDTFDDAFTLAHEAGHSMHTLYSNENQPIQTADYQIFVAEIASTFNEQLLLDYFMETCDDKNVKISLLQSAIDGILGTFYRQTLFANYEYDAFTKAANGEVITSEILSSIMKELYLQYYNIDLNNEPYKEFVWARIPHFFHSPFYVYQYATSFSASLKIYDDVKNKVDGALDRYFELLKSGGSDFPINLVSKAGVDLTSKDPFIAVVKRLDYLVDELEKLLN